MLVALSTTVISYAVYLILFTSWDKKAGRPDFQILVDVMTLKLGKEKMIGEQNKALGLNALTVLGLAFFPYFRDHAYGLIVSSIVQILMHILASLTVMYGTNKLPFISSYFKNEGEAKNLKKLSVIFGVVSNLVMIAYYFGKIDLVSTGMLALIFAIAHFYVIEMDFKWQLKLKPFAFAPMFVGFGGLV